MAQYVGNNLEIIQNNLLPYSKIPLNLHVKMVTR